MRSTEKSRHSIRIAQAVNQYCSGIAVSMPKISLVTYSSAQGLFGQNHGYGFTTKGAHAGLLNISVKSRI